MNVELTGPLTRLFDDKESRIEFPFVLTTEATNLEVKVRVRGKSRRKICKFPPLRLNFEATGLDATIFAGQQKLKLVTHCGIGRSSEKSLLAEYTAYQIFALLTDAAYRVRLLRITYFDTDKQTGDQQYGFVIETTDQLSERLGGEILELPGVVLSRLNREHAALVYVFQYLIGNTDWSLVSADESTDCCHNGKLIGIDREIYYVPYDFDLAGIVNASYAKPDPSLRLRSVRSRLYRGYCIEPAALQGAIRKLIAHEAEIYNVVNSDSGLPDKQKEKTIDYLAAFFDKSGDEEKMLKSFEKKCLG